MTTAAICAPTRLDPAVESPLEPARRVFHRDRHAPRAARRFTADTLTGYGISGDVLDTAVLLVDEIVTNSALYADRGDITVEISTGDKQIWFEVTDAGRARADVALGAEFDEMSEGGRGWFMVCKLAAECGIKRIRGGNGNRAFFVLDRDPEGAS